MNPLSDTQYEQFFLKLLDGVAQGWDSGQVLDYLGDRLNDRFFHNWLMRFGRDRLLRSPRPHRELASRMVRLGELGCGKIGELAHQSGTQKLAQPPSPLTEAEFESLFRELLQQRYQGCEAVRESLQELESRAQERDWLDWLEKAGETWLANPPEARFVQALQEFGNLGDFPLAQGVKDLGQQLQERLRVNQPPPSPPETGEMTSPVAHQGGTGGISGETGGSQEHWIFGNPEAKAAARRIYQLLHAGDYKAALMLANEAIEFFPGEWVLWGVHGDVLNTWGRVEEAVASYDRALVLNHKYAEAWAGRGNALDILGRVEEAVASYDRALVLHPNFAQAWAGRGAALSNLGRHEEAVASCERALVLDPNYAKAWTDRGNALSNLRRYEEAVASYDRALVLHPNDEKVWSNRGVVLNNLSRYEEAIASCDRALDLNAKFAEAWSNRGLAAGNSRGCFYSLTLTLPPHLQNPALDQPGYEGALASYEESPGKE